MPEPQYALVAYIRNSLGKWVEDLRRELHPPHGHLPAHITVLPPRCLSGTEAEAREQVEQACQSVVPFSVVLGDVEHFLPVTPTVFIRVARAGYRLRELHDRLNTGTLASAEQWPYMPHLTIVKVDTLEEAKAAAKIAAQRWAEFPGPHAAQIEELTFVRQVPGSDRWQDLAPFPLGPRLASTR
ncbi:MAG TPA: 2'-5' RNA ligase family protein [Terriglobales bacterium]|nr:2'-5' RNA ligase family protein [Terriglobales bacterium]